MEAMEEHKERPTKLMFRSQYGHPVLALPMFRVFIPMGTLVCQVVEHAGEMEEILDRETTIYCQLLNAVILV
jgi:hypothetical protein